MSNQNICRQLLEVLQNPSLKLQHFVNVLVNPSSEQQLKNNAYVVFTSIIQILKSTHSVHVYKRIAEFVMMAVLTCHFHLLSLINRYFLSDIIYMCTGVSRFNPIGPQKADLIQNNARLWKKQFVSQLINLLASWFPKDMINSRRQSRYVRIIRNKKIYIKGYYILKYQFIKQIERKIDRCEFLQGNLCKYCLKSYFQSKQQNELKQRQMSRSNHKNVFYSYNQQGRDKSEDHSKQIKTLQPVSPKLSLYQKLRKKKSKPRCEDLLVQQKGEYKQRSQYQHASSWKMYGSPAKSMNKNTQGKMDIGQQQDEQGYQSKQRLRQGQRIRAPIQEYKEQDKTVVDEFKEQIVYQKIDKINIQSQLQRKFKDVGRILVLLN